MGRKRKIDLVVPEIKTYFSKTLVEETFLRDNLYHILLSLKNELDLGSKTNLELFIETLIENDIIVEHKITLPSHYSNKKIYSKPHVTSDTALFYLFPNQHLSFYSALVYHNLTEQSPTTIYLREPTNKSSVGFIEKQISIDKAFSKEPRKTSKIGKISTNPDLRIVFTLGVYNSGNHLVHSTTNNFKVTNLEMTLLDALIKPEYCGGVWEVKKAFETAKLKVSISKLITYLDELNYLYPYHQRLGYYLTICGYPSQTISLLNQKERKWNFYLSHGIKEMDFNKEWKLYIPKGMK